MRIADDGEILVKGGNVCAGYFHDPKSTSELIDEDGWMHHKYRDLIDEMYEHKGLRQRDAC